jgi:hypothetical protein
VIDRVVTAGTFSLDGQDFDVENNVWIVGDDRRVSRSLLKFGGDHIGFRLLPDRT